MNDSFSLTAIYIIIAILLSALVMLVPYGIKIYTENRNKKKLQYALLAFQSHTNPHFIKNVLQAINWFILNNEKKLASDYLCDFSKLMEDILNFSKKKFVTLAEKLEFLDLYLKLQHLRHEDKFDYVPLEHKKKKSTISVENNINPDVFILPPLLIHPYIENAIEHGLKAKKTKGILSINFQFDNNKLICTVADNGIGLEASKKLQSNTNTKRSGIGIINTKKRIEIIKQLYGINIEVKMEELKPEDDEPGTLVTILFPLPLNFNPNTGMPDQIYS